jgi:hypothetical protein
MGSNHDNNVSDEQAHLFAQFQLFQRFLEKEDASHPKGKASIAGIGEGAEEVSEDEFDEASGEDSDNISGTQTPSNSIRTSQSNV